MTLHSILLEYSKQFHIYAEISDNAGSLVVSSHKLNNRSLFNASLPDMLSGIVLKTHPRDSNYPYYLYGSLTVDRKAYGFYLLAGTDKIQLQTLSAAFKLIVEQYLQTSAELSFFVRLSPRNTLSNLLVQHLLENPENDEIPVLIGELEFDTNLLYSVIVIDYTFGINQYFDINLNLGYEHSTQKTESELFHRVRHHRFLNSRDVVGEYGNRQIIIIKSLQHSSSQSRAYKMLDRLCEDIVASLSDLPLLNIRISHSCLFDNIFHCRTYYLQASEAISIGISKSLSQNIIVIDDIVLDVLLENLPEQIQKQCIDLRADALLHHQSGYLSCMDTCEAVINHNFNQSAAAEELGIHRNTLLKRMDKWAEMTGLHPECNFSDAIISKLLILSIRKAQTVQEEHIL